MGSAVCGGPPMLYDLTLRCKVAYKGHIQALGSMLAVGPSMGSRAHSYVTAPVGDRSERI